MRLMLDLPRGTHRRMIEPLSRVQHIKFALVKRFLSFIEQIRTSTKNSSKFLLESILLDTNSVTGSNLRNILLMTDKTSIHQLVPNDATIMKYHQMNEPELWKISIIEKWLKWRMETCRELSLIMMKWKNYWSTCVCPESWSFLLPFLPWVFRWPAHCFPQQIYFFFNIAKFYLDSPWK